MAKQSKLSSNKEGDGNGSRGKTPPIALKADIKTYKREDCMVIKCCSNPTDATSATYNLLIPVFKDRNTKEWLTWVKNAKQAVKAQNMTTGTTKFSLAKRLLDGGALIAFENAATVVASKTNDSFKQVIKSVTEHVFPKSGCQKQKSYMIKFLEKLRDLTVKVVCRTCDSYQQVV